MRIAPHTRIRADRVAAYEAAHREVPEELTAAMIAELDRLPVDIAWQVRMAELLDVVHDCSAQASDASPPVVWRL
ncbi:L-rhamnose mutarotase [Streptomyces sp. NPDC048481]|uniref:L-rhamnose mutarotase n=1 Tax=Streptomyces sp. NPDC048481 TaxID=3365557 RepID=UPI0037217647